MQTIVKFAPEFSYIVIILRDFTVHCVMVYFIVRVNRRESNIKAELAKEDSPHDLQELKTVLNSCRPLMCFSNYLDTEKPDHLVLLEYVKVYETIKDKEIDLENLLVQKADAYALTDELGESDPQLDRVKVTIAEIENDENVAKNSISDARMMLSEIFETKRESFYQCFTEFNSTMLGSNKNSKVIHRPP